MASPSSEQERETKEKVVGGNVTPTEEGEILTAFDKEGLGVKSRAARAVLLAFARSPEVRRSVATFLRANMNILAA